MNKLIGRIAIATVLAFTAVPALAQYNPIPRFHHYEGDDTPWKEIDAELPAFPTDESLTEFYVSQVATNKYFIDAKSLSVGTDGVVRYALVVRTSGGAQNISFEGIHCKERAWKLYATGQRDGTWSTARVSQWRPIENKPVNRHHAALSREFFCPQGGHILSANEGRNALRLGKHPSVN